MPTTDGPLHARVEESLRKCHQSLLKRGELLTKDRLAECYAVFRDRFGPDRLRSMDGTTLLDTMHAHGSRDSLVYWLEFKSDDEFSTRPFGSIAGGSALKFGLFKSQDSGEWTTGHPKSQITLTVDDAVAIARRHRDQLVAAVGVLQDLPVGASDQGYVGLQKRLDEVAPDVSRVAWGHKYLSLLFPDKLDDYHVESYQRYHLIKLLQLPAQQPGLYASAGRFVHLATLLGWPLNHLTASLNERDGNPVKYWRIGTRLGGEKSIWASMRDGGYAAIGWASLGDLSSLTTGTDLKEAIRQKLEPEYPHDPVVRSRKAGEIRNFVERIAEGDVVVAADGQSVVGLGQVTGPYRYENTPPADAPHRRAVDWRSTAEWSLPKPEGKLTTVFAIGKNEQNLVEIERRLLDAEMSPLPKSGRSVIVRAERLEGIPGRVQAILDRKGQVILYGPPGTGKTYWARKAALDLAALHAFGRSFDELSAAEKEQVEGAGGAPGLVRSCTFHPAYGYEDFIEGFRPQSSQTGQLNFQLRDGIFKGLCADAHLRPDRKFFLLIDEINRGDIPRIFGELLTLLELDKRGLGATLAVSGEVFLVPANLHVIGTMNTADRSIALLDTALRRRFGFLELMPDTSVFGAAAVGGEIPLGPWLGALNDRVRAHLGRDGRNLQIGHAYLLEGGKPVTDFGRFVRILAEDIVPLLEEYCYEDYGALTQILGPGMVDESKQRIREELFVLARRDELVRALLAPAPEIVTTSDAVAQATAPEEQEEPDSEESPM